MANRKAKKQNVCQRKLSKAQIEAKEKAAREAEERAEISKAKSERTRKIFTVVNCVILILALGVPAVALSVLGMG